MPHALWKRCDLHVHTPFDCSRTFGCDVSAAVSAAERGDERLLSEIAEKLFSRCVEACAGEPLHIAGLTDHNSIEGYKRLAPHLDRLGESARAEGKASCVFLPGVEVSIGTERALHINLIFAKQTNIAEIEKLLAFIFGKHEPFSDKGEPLSCMQSIEGFFENLNSFCRPTDRKRSISFVAIPSGDLDAGVWESLKGHLRTRGIKHPDWHAFFTKTDYPQLNQRFRELVSEWSELRFERSLEQASPEEKRRVSQRKYWPLLEGSDPHDWEDIGKRFTWMKMQSPDLEGIRLSLLDTESRLRRQAHGCPPDGHTQIKRIRITSADFIDDLEINFSSALNTLIGGRGSGKSTVLECLRLALDRGREADFSRSEEASRASFNRFSKKKEVRDFADTAGMILPGTKIEVDLCVNGSEYAVVWTPDKHRVDLKGDGWEDLDIRQLLGPRFLSQQQVAEIASDPVAQRRELDAQLSPERMTELCAAIEAAREKVSSLQAKRHAFRVHAEKHGGLRTQLKQINDKLSLLQSDENKESLTAFERFSAENAWLRAQRDQLRDIAAALNDHVTSLANIQERVPTVESPASPDLIAKVTTELRATYSRASTLVQQALEAISAAEKSLMARGIEWKPSYDAAKAKYQKVLDEFKAIGIDPKQHETLVQRRAAVTKEILEAEKAKVDLDANERELQGALVLLEEAYRARFELRSEFATHLSADPDSTDVLLDLNAFADRTELESAKDRFFGGTGFHEEDWENVCRYIFDQAPSAPQGIREVAGAIRHDVRRAKSQTGGLPEADSRLKFLLGSLRKNYLSCLSRLSEEMVDHLERYLPDDTVNTSVKGASGLFQPIQQGSLGQRATAILALLLAGGSEPLIIDQPEENLDNSYIYRVVVSLLRDQKVKRQLIFATHNANIPVNGDAECIVAMHVVDRLAAVKCCGSIDSPEVKDAVGEIMEGSSEAFRLRRLRYGF